MVIPQFFEQKYRCSLFELFGATCNISVIVRRQICVSRLEESSSGMGKKCCTVLFAECSVSALSMPLEIDMSVYTEAFKHA